MSVSAQYGCQEMSSFIGACLYAAHYNARRPHRALQLRPPRPEALVPKPVHGPIRRRPVLGGLINEYDTAA
jgi:putative transposase